MSVNVETFVTLGEYRAQVLGFTQREMAETLQCSQGLVSQLELGWLPKAASERRAKFLRAYQLLGREEHFERMVKNAQRLKALKTHIAEDFPLALFARPSAEAGGLVVELPPAVFLHRRKA